jgi:hypothetical protein
MLIMAYNMFKTMAGGKTRMRRCSFRPVITPD